MQEIHVIRTFNSVCPRDQMSSQLNAKCNQAVSAHRTWLGQSKFFLFTHCTWLFDPGAFARRTADVCQEKLP